jgi:hypothetical protein
LGAAGRGRAFRARTFRALTTVFFADLVAALALAVAFFVALPSLVGLAGLAVFALRGARLAGRAARFTATLRAAFFTVFFDPFWAMTTFSSNKSPETGLTYGSGLTDNRLLSAIPRTATDSPSKLEIRHRAAQEAPKLNG